MGLDGLPLAVEAEDLRPPLGRAAQSEQQADRGRLARSVGPEVADHLAPSDLEVQVIEGDDVAEALRQSFRT